MKKIFTLAIIAMVASLSFAQAPAQKKAASHAAKLEKVVSAEKMQGAMDAKAALDAKAQAAREVSGSVLRKAQRPATGAAMQMKAPGIISTNSAQSFRSVSFGVQTKNPAMQKSMVPSHKNGQMSIAAQSMLRTRTAAQKHNAPAAVAGAIVPTSSTLAAGDFYFYNVEYGGFLVGANDWGTRASVSRESGLKIAVTASGSSTYKLGAMSPDNVDGIWIDGSRAGNDQFTFAAGENNTYTIGNTKFEGKFITWTGDENNTRLNFTDEATNGTWTLVTPENYDAYWQAIVAADEAEGIYTRRMSNDKAKWAGATGVYQGGAERYNEAGQPEGDIMVQTIENLPKGTYEVKFAAVSNVARNLDVAVFAGEGIAYAFANGEEQDFTVGNKAALDASDWTNGEVTLTATVGEDGILKYGIKNRKGGSQWAVVKAISLTKLPDPIIIEATDAAATYYASDGDWYCVLQDADNNLFYFDIVTNNPAELEIGHEYTLADMDAGYSYLKTGGKKYAYSAATFTPKQGQYGVDYEATCVLASNGEVYHIFYTAPKTETLDVEATSVLAKFYGEPDNDWFINLSNADFEFRFDILNQSADGLILDHEYTLADMDASYSWGKVKATGASITYQSVSFKATTGANGTDYAATVVDTKGNTFNVKYTTVAPPPVTETVELEFAVAETDLVDAASTMGLIQFVGAKEETGLEAYVGLHATQVAGSYTFADVEAMYTSIYLDSNDFTGVQCADLTGTVTDLGNGAYKAYFEYLGTNGTLYKLTYNYGEAGGGNDDVVVTKDANGIITSVTGGESKTYTREGTAYFVQNSSMVYGDQEGVATIIEDAANGKVYIKDPVSKYTQGSWVEGTIEEGNIIVAAKQRLAYSSQYGATISLRWGAVTTSGNINAADAHADNFVYTIDGDKLILQGTESLVGATADAYFMGAFWDDDNSSTGYGDAETVLTYDPGYVGPSYDLVELPNGAQAADWYLNGSKVSSSTTTPVKNQAIKTAFVGDDVYVQGLFTDMPNAWVKGSVSGSAVTFAKGQYLGKYGSSYDIWFMGVNAQTGELVDATASYDASKNEITLATDILANAKPDAVYYLTWLNSVVLTKDAKSYEEPVITELQATLPYANTFDTENERAEAAIYDANDDGKTFTFADDSKSGSKTARYAYSTANDADDYVVFPGLTLEAGKSYKVSVDARPYGASYPERIEIVAGTVAKASGLNITVLGPTDLAAADYETLTADFVPEATGVYYIALHAISDADQFYLYTDNFSVKENNPNTPEAVASLVVTPDPNADLSAVIEFVAPAKTLAGDAITDQIKCVVMRDTVTLYSNIVVAAGDSVQLLDNTVPTPGTYTYSVTAIVGELISDAVKATVYVGEDLPLDVENLVGTDKNDKVALTWDAVGTVGAKGGVVKPENVTYNAYPVEMIEFFGMQFPSIDFENPYATSITGTSYDVEFNTNEGEQTYTYFGVTAENAAGETNGTMTAVLTGAPYELPMVEEFPNGSLTYWWGADYDDNIYEADGGLGLSAEGALVFDAPVAGWIELSSGKIALNGAAKPQLSFDYAGAGNLSVIVYSATMADTVALAPATVEGQKATFDLADYASESWIRFTVRGEFEAAGQATVDNIIVMDMLDNDLEVSVAAPKNVTAGATAKVVATVKNVGSVTASDYTVKFYVNEEEVAEETQVEAIDFLQTAQYTFDLETSVFDEAGDVTVKAEVVFAADEKPETNTDEVVLTVVAPTATPVASVVAEQTQEGVKVDWTVTSSSVQEVTEDFESYEGNTVYADGESCGPWAAVDAAPGDAYFWNSEDILWPHWENPYAFGIVNFEMSALSFEAVSGQQTLLFMSNTTAASKYMISSELPGVAQTISFQAMPITAQYGAETFEILASSTDANVASFTKVADFSIAEEEWTEFSANLPEGTKYFAIHYTSNDIFGLFIDDLKYTTGGGVATGFNVYVDKTLVATVGAEATTYTYTGEIATGNHDFSVTAVYGNSESAPVTATISVTSIESINANAAVEIYTVDGIRVNNVKELKAGVYVANGKKLVVE